MRILAVAGDASFLVALSLMAGGWEVVAAPDAAAAAPVAEADPTFDAAVVDLRTTERGVEAVNLLRDAGVAIPCLVVGDLAATHESATVITRPYTLEGLIGSLRAVMEAPIAGPSPVRLDLEAVGPAGEAGAAEPSPAPEPSPEAGSEPPEPAPLAPAPLKAGAAGAAKGEATQTAAAEAQAAEPAPEAAALAPAPEAAEPAPGAATPGAAAPAPEREVAAVGADPDEPAGGRPTEPAGADPHGTSTLPPHGARRPRRPGLLRGIVGSSGSWRPALRLAAQRATEMTDHAVGSPSEDEPAAPSSAAAPAGIEALAPAAIDAAAASAPSKPVPSPSPTRGLGLQPDPRATTSDNNRSLRRMFRLSAGPEAGIEQPQRQRDTLRRLETAAVGLAATIGLLEELPMASDVGAVARAYLEEVVETLAPEVATLYLAGAGGTFWPAVHVGLSQVEARMPVPADHPLFVDVATRLGAVLVAPVHLVHGLVAGIGGARTETLMAAPLQLGGVCYGVGIAGGDAYGEADLDVFVALGLQAAGPLAVALRLHQLGQIRGERQAN